MNTNFLPVKSLNLRKQPIENTSLNNNVYIVYRHVFMNFMTYESCYDDESDRYYPNRFN